MSLIQKSSIRKLVNSRECRISPDAFDGINRAVENLVDKMIANVKADGMKTLQTKHTGGVKTDENAETVYDFLTGSYFQPYITTVGLYNNANELVAVGKLAQPLQRSDTTDTTILVNLDL